MAEPDLHEIWLRTHGKAVRATARRDFASNVMNNTKWMEAVLALGPLTPVYRMKLIHEAEVISLRALWAPTSTSLDTAEYGPLRPIEIEWLDVLTSDPSPHTSGIASPASSFLDDVAARLELAH